MLSKQEEQEDRNEYLENVKRLREQGTTLARFAQSEASEAKGRFSAINSPTVIGSTPNPAPNYPAGASWTRDPCGPEASFGVDINRVEKCG